MPDGSMKAIVSSLLLLAGARGLPPSPVPLPSPIRPPAPAPSPAAVSPLHPALHLDSYLPLSAPVRLEGVEENASGLAFKPDPGTLYLVVNNPPGIVELTPEGARKRAVRLEGFEDPEGIAWLGSDSFAVVEEKRGAIAIFDLPPGADSVGKAQAREITVEGDLGNSGLEGIAYDPGSDVFYVVKEKDPKKIYRVTRKGEISNPWPAEAGPPGISDMSDIYFHPPTGHLVILSHESAAAVECTIEGKEVSRLPIDLRQAEGATLDGRGRLYICGEPYWFQAFEPGKQ